VRHGVSEGFHQLVARTIPNWLRGLGNPRVVGEDTCPTGDATTPNRFPVIDATAEMPSGIVVATGLQGSGIMASPAVATAVRALVTREPC